MVSQKLEKATTEYLFSLLNATQKLVIQIRSTPYNETVDFITLEAHDDSLDRPNPLRIPEIMIIICVLLLWCGSIVVFIRHSELLRIRHRDLPYHSPAKETLHAKHLTSLSCVNSVINRSKSQVSSNGCLTPQISIRRINSSKHGDTMEVLSLGLAPLSRKRQNTRSFDLNERSLTKYFLDKHDEKESLLHPEHVSSDIKYSLLDLHRKSMDNLHRKSMVNLSTVKYATFYSINEVAKKKNFVNQRLFNKKQNTEESPV